MHCTTHKYNKNRNIYIAIRLVSITGNEPDFSSYYNSHWQSARLRKHMKGFAICKTNYLRNERKIKTRLVTKMFNISYK